MVAAISPAMAAQDPNDYTDAIAAIEKIRLTSSKTTHGLALFTSTREACLLAIPDTMINNQHRSAVW
jgi:hypothetical protein